ncbi:UPF0103-domain-containing protein [Meredithblackwellia eburnea MCA 4105]
MRNRKVETRGVWKEGKLAPSPDSPPTSVATLSNGTTGMGQTREASHAGSWYTANKSKLKQELSGYLSNVVTPSDQVPFKLPVKNSKAIISPHAGYSYSGPAAAWAYASVDVQSVKRVFVLGPSHHVYLEGCALSSCDKYETPLGDLDLDLDTMKELEKTGKFEKMSQTVDEDEHSIEMQLPYIAQIFSKATAPPKLVPILVGSLTLALEQSYGQLLAPYLRDPQTLFIISSDFCHWGTRFSYTYFQPPGSKEKGKGEKLGRGTNVHGLPCKIHESIKEVDWEGMEVVAFSPSPSSSSNNGEESLPSNPTPRTPSTSHGLFNTYLQRTRNTICGRHPIGVLLGTLAALEKEEGWEKVELRWTRYERSSLVVDMGDSSVSYASAVVGFEF